MKIRTAGIAVLPWLIIAGLLYAGMFIKPKEMGKSIDTPPIEHRDSFYDVALPIPNVIWAVGTNGKIVRSDDTGKTWLAQRSQVAINLQSIAVWDDRRAVAVGNEGVTIITRDGGNSWSEVKVPLSSVSNKLIRVRTAGDGIAWAVGEMGTVLHTSDFGATWTRASQEQDTAWNDIGMIGRKGWIVGEFGKIMITDDAGKTWAAVNSPVKTSLMSVAFNDESNGIAVGLEGAVLTTADGGKSWKESPRVTTEHLFDVISDRTTWWVVGDKGVLLSGDMASGTWKRSQISPRNLSWNTKVQKMGDRLYFAGASLGMLEHSNWSVFGN
ncbi:MAG: glycosyl hydrolase [Betaproteobacteria bacterium]|nr:glycosyl hydrolase [Betaproteobacteria bacterium]